MQRSNYSHHGKEEAISHGGNSSQHHHSAGRRRRRDAADNMDGFGEFPPQMTVSTPEISTPQTTNKRVADPQSRIRFAEGTRLSPTRTSNQVLVLGGGSSSNNRQSQQSSATTVPTSTSKLFPDDATSLDFSMIATPGGKLARMVDSTGLLYTPSEAITATTTASSGGRWTSPFSNILRGVVSSTPNIHPRQLSASSTPYTAARELLNQNQTTPGDGVDINNDSECTALTFSRSAPLSGYLRKLGKNIPTFKRRFFVLKPSTHLYYFMSPNDVEPRGCIDLDMVHDDGEGGGCEVREIGLLPDGTFRFELLFNEVAEDEDGNSATMEDNASSDNGSRTSQNSKRRNFQRHCVFESRTEDIGREWMAKLQSERLSVVKDEVDFLRINLTEMKSISARWEHSACEEAMRADEVERQRNTAISEAKIWEGKFTHLNEAIQLLLKNNKQQQEGGASSEFLTEALDGLDVNGTNFNDISEAFQMIHNDYNLVSKREEEAKARIAELERRAKKSESRAAKAEAELSLVWEDNRLMQNDLKKTRREKKILVKEVRSLQASEEENASKQSSAQHNYCDASETTLDHQKHHDLRSLNSQSDSRGGASDTASYVRPRRKMNDEERRLVIELEEHVMSGLRLSEQFLTLNGIDPSEVGDDLDNSVQGSIQVSRASLGNSPERQPRYHSPQKTLLDLSPYPSTKTANEILQHNVNKPLGSLLDENDDDSEVALVSAEAESTTPRNSNKEVDINTDIDDDNLSSSPTLHLRPWQLKHIYQYEEASSGDPVNQNLNDRFRELMPGIDTPIERESTSNHRNTQQQLHLEGNATSSLDMASSVSESSRSRVTDNGHATTKLECPLKDVGETPTHNRPSNFTLGDDGKVYHITFYSNKIGLQFQKVPNETKSPGLLTDAMTADHGPNVETNQTAAELRRIASISQHSQTRNSKATECLPFTPADAVLVCGFVGFDDSTGNVRPRIGARLVAFDGMTVEVGQWTFETIRKSIQARGRPLTLSFRNDFLTPKQREILTKAIGDVNPPPQSVAHSNGARGTAYTRERYHDYHGPHNTIHRSSSSVSSQPSQPKRYYSFSEAGSSISSAVAPLMANLLNNNRSSTGKKDDFAPSYLKRTSDSLDKMRHHHDFQSGLL